ncbi:MAG: PorV/PorQ family protein [Elusimicrobia bacterium]|nr:PorV/PorQ family protein [Elusimicrobiota bacterium]
MMKIVIKPNKKGRIADTAAFLLILFLIIFTSTGTVFSGKGPGSSGYEFLNIPVGSREAAIGAGTAIAHNPNAFWWNPAGIAFVERFSVSLMYNKWFEDITQQRAGCTFPMMQRSVGAVNVSMLSVPGIEGYSWFDIPTGEVQAKDYCASYTQAKYFSDLMVAGLTLKGVVEQLDDVSVYAMALDIGAISSPVENLWLSAGVKNAGVSKTHIEEKGILPISFFTGLGIRMNKLILFASDITYIDQEIKYGAGAEFNIFDLLYIRCGTNNFADAGDNIQAGAGWKIKDIGFDYAYVPYGKLGSTHRVDLNIMFGDPPLIEQIYRNAVKLFKQNMFKEAWIEFNKVKTLDAAYKKVGRRIREAEEKMKYSISTQPGDSD